MAEHICVKFVDPSCSGFEMSCGKTHRQTLLKTVSMPLPQQTWMSVHFTHLSSVKEMMLFSN